MKKLKFDRERVAIAGDLRLRWHLGEKTERTPFIFTVTPDVQESWMPGNPYDFPEMITDTDKMLEGALMSIQHHFDTFPDCDYLPALNMFYLGEGILASMYGAEQYLVEKNPPFTKGRLFRDIYEAQNLSNDIDFEKTRWGGILKEHITRFVDATNGEIPVEVADYQSPYGTATKLVPNEELMLAMFDVPELVHEFLSKVTDGIIKLIKSMERWIGPEHLAWNIKTPIPGKCGIILWDDYVSVLTPALHTEFCAPCNKRLYDYFGRGHLHTCGPYFPSFIDACLACDPHSLDISIMRGQGKTREDLVEFFNITSKKNIRLYGSLNFNEKSIFESGVQEADDELLAMFIRGGYMPSGGGTYEQGLKFRETIEKIDRGDI